METSYVLDEAKDYLPIITTSYEETYTNTVQYAPTVNIPSLVSTVTNKPILEDLPLDEGEVPSMGLDEDYSREFAELWEKSEGVLIELQRHVKTVFKGAFLNVNDIQQALGKVILNTKIANEGSNMIPLFLKASKKKDYGTISKVFESFGNQAERFARLIILERQEPAGSRLISDAHVGGVAGGSKFIAGYVIFSKLKDY
jgi:hypothetical protein